MGSSTLLNNVREISNSVGIRGNYTEKGSDKLYYNEVSPCVDPVMQAAVGEAKERLKKLEKDYQRTYKKYREVQSNRYRCFIQGKGSEHHSRWVGYCTNHCKNLVKQLQNVLDRLNIEEATRLGIETPNHRKRFLMLHGCTSLTQEKTILQQKAECKQPNNDKLIQKKIDLKAINWEFRIVQREIPRISSKKHVHDLLSRLMETNKMREKATVGGAMVGNATSQNKIKSSTSIVIKVLEKVIKELEKEREETDNILRDGRMKEKGYTAKMRHLQEKREWICGEWDDERKYMLGLMNIHDGMECLLPIFQRWIH